MRTLFKILILSMLVVSSPISLAQQDNRAAAVLADEIITYQDITAPIASQIYDAEIEIYELKLNQLKSQILARLIEKHPLSQGVSTDIFVQKYITKNPQVTDLEVDRFITENRVPPQRVNADFKQKVKSFMLQQKNAKAINQWIDSEGKKYGLVISLQAPERPRTEIAINGAPTLGPDSAPITIVEYSDFQCPYCARALDTIKQIRKNYPDKVQIVYKQYPLDFHKDAFRASEASLCANEQSSDTFWKLHDYMLANPRSLGEANLIAKAAEFGVNREDFEKCLKSGKYVSKVQQEMAEGNKIGVSSTPMFFVNGITVKGAQPYSVFEELIEEELSRLSKK